jgi:hypothetical protein
MSAWRYALFLSVLSSAACLDAAAQAPRQPAPSAPESQPRQAPAAQRPAPRQIEAMTFELASNNPSLPLERQIRWVAARGQITRETPAAFDAFLAKNDIKGLTIYFDSSGGSIQGGLALGEKLRKIEAKVSIGRSTPVDAPDAQGAAAGAAQPRRHQLAPNQGICNSSCTYAFLGGATRSVPSHALFGVHMFWPSEKTEGLYQQTYGPGDIENAQRTAARIAAYIQRMGVDLRMFEIASSVPHRSAVRGLTNKEIVDLRIASIDNASLTPAAPGLWGLTITRTGASLVTSGAIADEAREGVVFQLEFTCSDTPGFHNARFEISLTKALPRNTQFAMRRVLMASGSKDAVLAVSGKDIRPMPATFNRFVARGAGGWISKGGTVVSEVLENAARTPSDGLRMIIDEGDGVTTIVPIVLGNFGERHKSWAAACDGVREARRPAAATR